MIKLSILIPTLPERSSMLDELLSDLYSQYEEWDTAKEIEILVDSSGSEMSIGSKRQKLLERAQGEFVTFIDDDDTVMDSYVWDVFFSIVKFDPDVVSFNGFMTTGGKNRENFKIMKDLPYLSIKDANGKTEYLRFNNHLSPIRKEIALQIGYKDLKFAEDYDYAKRLKESGLIKTEHYINKYLYHYKFILGK